MIFFGVLLVAVSVFAAEKSKNPQEIQEQTWPSAQGGDEWPTVDIQQEWPANQAQNEWPADQGQNEWPANQDKTEWPGDHTQKEWPNAAQSAEWPNAVYPQEGSSPETATPSNPISNEHAAAKPAEPLSNFYFLDFKWILTSASTNYAGKAAKYRSSDGKAALRISQNTQKPSCEGWTTCEEKQCKNSKNKYWFLTTAAKTESWISVDVDKKGSMTHNTKKKTNPFDLYLITSAGSIRFQMENSQSPVLEEKFYSKLLCDEGEEILPKIIATL